MGTFRVTFEVGDPSGSRYEPIEALVAPGASYTMVPAPILERLGVRREWAETFELADAGTVDLDFGQTSVRVAGRTVTTLVVFAEPGSQPILGAYTLEGVRLAADPVHQQLVPVPRLLLAINHAQRPSRTRLAGSTKDPR
jgi:predicted aspartyl protease